MKTESIQYGRIPLHVISTPHQDAQSDKQLDECSESKSRPTIKSPPSRIASTLSYWYQSEEKRFIRRQICAILLLLVLGIGPFLVEIGLLSSSDNTLYEPPLSFAFGPKTKGCRGSSAANVVDYGPIQTHGRTTLSHSSDIKGVEAMFVLDYTAGDYPFSLAKTIDVLWDVGVGRSVQFVAGWISYSTFSAAVLRMIERHPASYNTFLRINLEGTSLASLWTLLQDLVRIRSKRTGALFSFLILSIIYVFSIPVALSAMTGYDISTDVWVNIEGKRDGLIRMSDLKEVASVYGARNLTFPTPQCATDEYYKVETQLSYYGDHEYCMCKPPDGGPPILFTTWREDYRNRSGLFNWNFEDCRFDFPGSNFAVPGAKCNQKPPSTVSFLNQTFQFDDLRVSQMNKIFCYKGRSFTQDYVYDNLRCLPNTEQHYEWGFSTMLSTLFLIVHFVWSICMYIVWQDAELKSKLVRRGFKLTQLRAIFALAATAERETGLHNEALVRLDAKELDNMLFRSKGGSMDGVVISSEIFEAAVDGQSSLKKRKGRIQEDEF